MARLGRYRRALQDPNSKVPLGRHTLARQGRYRQLLQDRRTWVLQVLDNMVRQGRRMRGHPGQHTRRHPGRRNTVHLVLHSLCSCIHLEEEATTLPDCYRLRNPVRRSSLA